MKGFDFESAKIKHSLWSSRLRSYIYGDKQFEDELKKTEHQCDLGKWIDANAEFLQTSPIFEELQEVHTKIHQYTADLVNLRKTNADLLIVAENYKTYDIEMRHLLSLLDAMKKELT